MRVAKADTNAWSHRHLQQYWNESIRPLFEEDQLVQQCLVELLRPENLVHRLNSVLSQVEGRREDFRASKVGEERYGMLVEDMRKRESFQCVA